MEETAETRRIVVEGLVQAVGFRPFIARVALQHGLTGRVSNTTGGVTILARGTPEAINGFLDAIRREHPPLAVIKSVETTTFPIPDSGIFEIASSEKNERPSIFIPPDIATCPECEKDFDNPSGRYSRYPFVNCTNCGPRFSIITGFPYDRNNTTMTDFTLCADCSREYRDITSRRYHAEPVSCERCGPRFSLLDAELHPVETDNVFGKTVQLLHENSIVATKGIGGFHLILDAMSTVAVQKLRLRKKRDRKPFALMFKDMETIAEYCCITAAETKLLAGNRRPIVLLPVRKHLPASEAISGSSPWYGVMLPYAPFHKLLLETLPVLVFTSGNLAGEPIVYRDSDLARLMGLADNFLIHDRRIARFVEDSVVKVVDDEPLLLRKSRGYAPSPLFLHRSAPKVVAGMGSDLKASISLLNGDALIQSQYLGDLADLPSYEEYSRSYDDLRDIFQTEPDVIACDLHPAYLSSRFAESKATGRPLVKVQHHKAHTASVALEQHWYEDRLIGLALDGTGYGDDGQIWGGEVFTGSLELGFSRTGRLAYLPFPFGDAAVRDPEKTALSFFLAAGIDERELLPLLSQKTRDNYGPLRHFIASSTLHTSSTGRLFDAVSWLLGFRQGVSYEGEAAVALENHLYAADARHDSDLNATDCYAVPVKQENGLLVLDTRSLLSTVFSDWKAGTPCWLLSFRFHQSLVAGLVSITSNLAAKHSIHRIALSGGCFQNSFLIKNFGRALTEKGYQWAANRYSPPNDACVSVGQCAIAAFTR